MSHQGFTPFSDPFASFEVPRGIPNGPGDVDARAGWWTRSTGIGNQQSGNTFPQTAGSLLNVVSEDALGPPRPVTFTMHAEYDYREGANCAFRAHITVGAGGTSQELVCDWLEGVQLALSAAGSLRISAIPYAPIPGQPYNPNASFRIGGSLSLTTGGHPQPRYTQRLLRLEDEDLISALVTPPKWAESLQVQLLGDPEDDTDPYTSDVQLRFHDPSGAIFSVVPCNRFPQDWAAVPAGSRVSLRNWDAEAAVTPTLIWRLAL